MVDTSLIVIMGLVLLLFSEVILILPRVPRLLFSELPSLILLVFHEHALIDLYYFLYLLDLLLEFVDW